MYQSELPTEITRQKEASLVADEWDLTGLIFGKSHFDFKVDSAYFKIIVPDQGQKRELDDIGVVKFLPEGLFLLFIR